jgi:hypothetical protein
VRRWDSRLELCRLGDMILCEGELCGFAVLPEENTLERSVAPSEYSIELLAYDEDPLVSDTDCADAADTPDCVAPDGYSLGS